VVLADPTRVRQLLINLVGNAVKFSEHGEISVELGVVRGPGGTRQIRCQVSDQGIGIAPDKVERIFGAFEQADLSTSKEFGGTGLGLAICLRLVQLMGGEIGVESEPGRGSRFHFTLPLLACPESRSEAAHNEPIPYRHALVVDDIAANRNLIEGLLAGWGIRCAPVASAAEALLYLERQQRSGAPVDLVICDQGLPGLDGLSLVEMLRQRCQYAGLPVLILVQPTQRLERARQLELALGVLNKPLLGGDLREALISLSRPVADEAPSGTTPAPEATGREVLQVLLVDDVPINRELGATILKRLGHQVTLAAHGEEAIALVTERHFDIVFMDVQMPGIDGLEATRRIRQVEALGRLPIVAMTAYAMQGDREKCLEAGMDDYVSKPVRRDDIAAAISRRLGGRVAHPMASTGSPEQSGEQQPVFDLQGLVERLGGKADAVQRFLQMFFKSADLNLDHLAVAVENQDREGVRIYAHTVHGASLNIGAQRLAQLTGDLEVAAKAGEIVEAGTQLEAIQAAYREFCAVHHRKPGEDAGAAVRREPTAAGTPAGPSHAAAECAAG